MIQQDPGPFGNMDPIQMLQFLMGLKERKLQHTTEQAKNLLSTTRPGTPIEQTGLNPKQQKALFGRTLAPGATPVPASGADMQDDQLRQAITLMTPDQLNVFRGSLINKTIGTPGANTVAGITAGGQAEEVKAGTRLAVAKKTGNWIIDGLQAIDNLPLPERARAGAQLATGMTPEGLTQAGDDAKVARLTSINDYTKAEITRLSLDAMRNPNNPLNRVMKANLGFNAIDAAGGVAMGMASLMDEASRIAAEKDINSLTSGGRMGQIWEQADADAAVAISKSFGGKFTPRMVRDWMYWKASPSGTARPPVVTAEMDQAMSLGTAAAFRAEVNQAIEKGDPDAQNLQNILSGMSKITNANQLTAYAQLSNDYYARVHMNQTIGPRPAQAQDPAGAALWDAQLKAFKDHMPKLDANFWMTGGGVDVSIPGSHLSRQPAPGMGMPGAGGAPGTSAGPGAQPAGPSPQDIQNIQMLIKLTQPNADLFGASGITGGSPIPGTQPPTP